MPHAIHAIIRKPKPYDAWGSSAAELAYAFSFMQECCPTLDFDYVASLSFSASVSVLPPLPAHYHRITLTGPDVLTIQRLIPAFSNSAPLAKSAQMLPRVPVIWLESID